MTRPTRLALVTLPITHHCPYKQRDAQLARCYIDSNDVAADVCYGCDHVAKLKARFGLRTFKRTLVINRCAHCRETADSHEGLPPHIGTRAPCPGFDDSQQDVPLHVPLNAECTDWMVVLSVTGHRYTMAEYRERRLAARDPGLVRVIGETATSLAMMHLPLAGSPVTEIEKTAATLAERARRGYGYARQDEANNEAPPRKRKAVGSRRRRR